MIDRYTALELAHVSYKLGLENNALLRIVISNQVAIMEKLNIARSEMPGVTRLIDNIQPDAQLDPADLASLFIKAADPLSEELSKRAWEWLQMNAARVAYKEENDLDD